MEITLIIIAILLLAGFIYRRYRRYQRRKDSNPIKMLWVNNEVVRETLKAVRLKVNPCAYQPENNTLISNPDNSISGFNMNNRQIIRDSQGKSNHVIDCGTNVKRFIYEVKNSPNASDMEEDDTDQDS